jgi:endonuclease-8
MEGPSVHLAAERISFLEGQTIEEVYGNARQPLAQLRGEQIEEVRAVRKRLFIDTTGLSVVTHFLMYGSYRINKRRDKPERIGIGCTKDSLNIYNASVKVLNKESEEYKEYDRPDRDVLSTDFDRKYALHSIGSDDRIIADVLLDQDIFGGVGNIIKNEVLYLGTVDPRSIASSIPRKKAEDLIKGVVEFSASWLEAKLEGRNLTRAIYSRQECECGRGVVRENLGEYDRLSFYCPSCQTVYT